MNANEFIQSMQSLGTRYLEEYTRMLQRYADFAGSVAEPGQRNSRLTEPADLAAMQKRYTDFVVSEAPRLFAQVSEANLNYYSALTDLGLRSYNNYMDSVLRTMSATSRPCDHSVPGGGNELLFHGLRGQSASNAFLISNNRDDAIDVEFDIAEVRAEEGDETFKPQARFTPQKCRLAPHSERVIQCTLPLSGKFVAGQRYGGSIAVVGYPEMAIRIGVEVEDEAPGTPAKADSKPASRKSRSAKPTKKASKKRTTRKTGN